MLMNGKEVNHLIIAGETFDKSYVGKKVDVINSIYGNSYVTFSGKYSKAYSGWILPKGTKGYAILYKFYDNYYIMPTKENEVGVWAQSSDIKILD